MKKWRTRCIPGSHFNTEEDCEEWNTYHNEKCDPGGESDYRATRLFYDNRESMDHASHTLPVWVR